MDRPIAATRAAQGQLHSPAPPARVVRPDSAAGAREKAHRQQPSQGAGRHQYQAASVATYILGVSGRAMLRALIEGQKNPQPLAELAPGQLRGKIPELEKAL